MAKKKQQQRNNKKKKNRNRNQAAATSQSTADADDSSGRDAGAEYLTNSGNAMRAYQNLSEEEKANVNVEDLKKVCVIHLIGYVDR